jgi:splicing factor U2AF subunit
MAEHLASIFGTEKDRVNCPFYFKIGCARAPRAARALSLRRRRSPAARRSRSRPPSPSPLPHHSSACRHGQRCSRLHSHPSASPTVLLGNLYPNPVLNAPLGRDGLPAPVDAGRVQRFFEDFYEDLFLELDRFGELESLCVCDNLADHMVGNVYAKFVKESAAAAAVAGLAGRYYAGKPIAAELSPVVDFRESTCRQYEEGACGRGGYCNFMHVRPVGREVRRQLFGRYRGGAGGSTKFHEGGGRGGGFRGGGGGGYRGSGGGNYGGGYGQRGGDDRGRRDERGYGGSAPRESSAERRVRIAQWSGGGGGGGEAAMPPPAMPPPAMPPPPY